MANLHIGDSVTFRDRTYFVPGMSPMAAVPRRVFLEDVETGAQVEAPTDQVHAETSGDGRNEEPSA